MSPERIERVRRLGAGWVESGLTPALQVLVARRGVIVLHEAWGRLGPEDDAPPLTHDSVFGTGSLTKAVTATAIMCLVEDGLLSLNRPVQGYVPEFEGAGKAAVLVHHLLTHTSGLSDEDLDTHFVAGLREGRIAPVKPLPNVTEQEILHLRGFDALYDAPLSKPPGTDMTYCSYGYRLLAEVVSRVAGQPADRFVEERILAPLGMTSTSYLNVPPDRLVRVVRRASDAPRPVMCRPDTVASFALGAGAVHANARDLAAFAQTFLNGGIYDGTRILSPPAIAEMTRNQIPGLSATLVGEFFPEASWGYGWSVRGPKKGRTSDSLLSGTAFEHGGIDMNMLWADPTYDLVGVYLSVLPPAVVIEHHAGWRADLFVNAVMASIVD